MRGNYRGQGTTPWSVRYSLVSTTFLFCPLWWISLCEFQFFFGFFPLLVFHLPHYLLLHPPTWRLCLLSDENCHFTGFLLDFLFVPSFVYLVFVLSASFMSLCSSVTSRPLSALNRDYRVVIWMRALCWHLTGAAWLCRRWVGVSCCETVQVVASSAAKVHCA